MSPPPPAAPSAPSAPPAAASVPPVVAVVVTRDPGPWLEEVLGALAVQDYPDLSVLVIDAASAADPTPRVAAVMPTAYVRRLDINPGFAAAANEVLRLVEGASHFVFLHDDAAPAPDAVRLLVEEAYRSNAGVVSPKLVAWDNDELILAVGMTADKAGNTTPFGRGELDQEQHDAVRDVFVAPGGCQLVRADLFAEMGGFDEAMPMFGEDLDLSWRAQLAGARVVVAPSARVRHLEATAAGIRSLHFGPPEGELTDRVRPLELRHRLRSVLKCYGALHLGRVLPQLVLLALGEAVYSLATRRTSVLRALVAAWRWNLAPGTGLRRARRVVQRGRRLPDGPIRRLQSRGSARVTTFVRGQLVGPDRALGMGAAGRELADIINDRAFRTVVTVWAVVALVLLVGTRELLFGDLPAIGQFVPFPDSPLTFLRHFGTGWRTTGLGGEAPAPAAFGVLGLLGVVAGGAMGLLQKLLVLGAIPAGILGAWRAARPVARPRPRLVAAVLYAAVPLPYDAIAQGRWAALLAYAAMPWLLARLLRATGLPPWGAPAELAGPWRWRAEPTQHRVSAMDDVAAELGPEAGTMDPIAAEEYLVAEGALHGRPEYAHDEPGEVPHVELWTRPLPPPPPFRRQVVAAAVLLALVGALALPVAAATLLAGVGLAAGAAVAGVFRAGLRALGLAALAVAGALVLLFPWTLTLLDPAAGWAAFAGAGPAPAEAPSLGALLRFDTGPVGMGWFGFALLVTAALPLLIGRRWRFNAAVQLWFVAMVTIGLTWLAARGWLGVPPPAVDVLLTPAAAALALAAALGLAAFQTDLPGYRFGWRQVASVVAAGAAALAVIPVLVGTISGRWEAPRRDVAELLAWLPPADEGGAYRVLWIGGPQVLPLDGWPLAGDLAYGTSDNGPPDAVELWPGPDEGATGLLADALAVARADETTRLGHLLAIYGVRYLVLVEEAAPAAEEAPAQPLPAELTTALDAQIDLRRVDTDPAIAVYENVAWAPVRTMLPAAAVEPSQTAGVAAARTAELAGAVPVLLDRDGPVRFSGEVPAGELYVAEAASARWQLTVDGEPVDRRRAFGWANAWSVPAGEARLVYRTGPLRWLAVGLQLALVGGAVAELVRGRRRRLRASGSDGSPQAAGEREAQPA